MPSNAQVSSATLELYALRYMGGSTTGDYAVYKLSRSWVESEANWANASASQTWTKAGGDYVSSAVASATVPRSNGTVFVRYNVLAAVSDFVKNPQNNFGFLAINTRRSQTIIFASSENRTAENRPKLTVTYESSASVTARPALKTGGAPITVRAKGGELHLSAPGARSNVAVSVYRADGALALVRRVAPQGHTVVSGLAAGVYFIGAGTALGRGYTAVSITP
ncbi:MAG: DNRLRE domain-containing protein [Chitinispirillaceae bacterium]|nr:DNRLRE domain-containing protein [Chitinispirillaceae bacterium]